MIKKLLLILIPCTMLTSCTSNKNNIPKTITPQTNISKTITTQTSIDVKGIDLKIPIAVDEKKIANLPNFPEKIRNKDELIPSGWSILDILQNDFNNDGLADIVGVIEHPSVEDEIYPRVLFVYINNGNGYDRNLINQYLIRNRDEGGIMGDPYRELTAGKNTFTTHTFGGSAWKWSENYTFEYINGEWILLYEENSYGYGPFETSYSYNDYKLGIGKRRYTEESPEKENASKLEFTVKLDKQPLLNDFAYHNFWGTDRLKAPIFKSFGYNEGVPHFTGDIPPLNSSNISFQNKDYIIYKVKQSEKTVFLGIYDYSKEHLQIIARYSTDDNNEINISDDSSTVYKNRLYFEEEITKVVNIKKDGEIKKQPGVVGVQLVSMNLDGSDKKVIFKANHSKYKENEIIDNYLDYIALIYEITGDELIIEVFSGNVYPYYRMNLDGTSKNLIGSVPRGAW